MLLPTAKQIFPGVAKRQTALALEGPVLSEKATSFGSARNRGRARSSPVLPIEL